MEKKLLVLDLDETLIHSSEKRLADGESFLIHNFFVYKRPYLDWFMSEMLNTFEVAIWSAAGHDYVHSVICHLFQRDSLKFVWTSQNCTLSKNVNTGEYDIIKNLRKLKNRGYPLESIVVIDDSSAKHRRNYGNLVTVKEFLGDQNDNDLQLLAAYLKQLAKVPNIRNVEKRGWRTQVGGI